MVGMCSCVMCVGIVQQQRFRDAELACFATIDSSATLVAIRPAIPNSTRQCDPINMPREKLYVRSVAEVRLESGGMVKYSPQGMICGILEYESQAWSDLLSVYLVANCFSHIERDA